MVKGAKELFVIFYIFMLMLSWAYAQETKGTVDGDDEETATTHEQKESTRTDITSLSWEGSTLKLLLFAPNGTMISPDINTSEVKHVIGANYDYYLLQDIDYGKWTLEVVPVDVKKEGENFVLFTGAVNETNMVVPK